MISQFTTLHAHVTGWSIRNSYDNKRHLYALRFCKFSQRCNWYFPSSGIWHRFAGHLALQTSRLLPTNPWRDIKLQKNKSHMSRLGANFPPRYEYNMKDVTNNLFVTRTKARGSQKCLTYILVGVISTSHQPMSSSGVVSARCMTARPGRNADVLHCAYSLWTGHRP